MRRFIGCILLAGLVGMLVSAGRDQRGPVSVLRCRPGCGQTPRRYRIPDTVAAVARRLDAPARGRGSIEEQASGPGNRSAPQREATSSWGFIQPDRRYLSLTQSSADEGQAGVIHPSMYPTGTVGGRHPLGRLRFGRKRLPSSRYGRHGSPDQAGPQLASADCRQHRSIPHAGVGDAIAAPSPTIGLTQRLTEAGVS